MTRIYDFTPDEPARPSPPKKHFVCPECHRRFHGKGALRQHTRDNHPTEENTNARLAD